MPAGCGGRIDGPPMLAVQEPAHCECVVAEEFCFEAEPLLSREQDVEGSRFCNSGRVAEDCLYAAEVTMSLWRRLRLPRTPLRPPSPRGRGGAEPALSPSPGEGAGVGSRTHSPASRASSGWLGFSPCVPKSSGVATSPRRRTSPTPNSQ